MLNSVKKPELLAPGGDMEKLKTAVHFGADAVYVGGQRYGLRAGAKNFGGDELAAGVRYAHERGVKVYVTVNIFAHEEDFDGLAAYLKILETLGADGILISDPGVFALAKEAAPGLPLHISTQANTTNARSAAFWRELGARRVVLARELSLSEISTVSAGRPSGLELEVFVHGAMCMAYSGRCLLSHVLTGRDANRGECAQPCRWNYHLSEAGRPGEYYPIGQDERGSYILNSRDLCMIEHLPELLSAGADALKIEGRMKSSYYVAVTTRAYRRALDDCLADPAGYAARLREYAAEAAKASHRRFSTGFYFGKPGPEGQDTDTAQYIRRHDFLAVVEGYDPNTGIALLEQRNKFAVGDEVEFMTPEGGFFQTIVELWDGEGNAITAAPHPQMKLRVKTAQPVRPLDVVRKERADAALL